MRTWSGTYSLSTARDGLKDGAVTVTANNLQMAVNRALQDALVQQKLGMSADSVYEFSLSLSAE